MFEAIRVISLFHHKPSFMGFTSIKHTFSIVGVAAEYKIYDYFYSRDHLYNPLRGTMSLEQFGSTSALFSHHLYDLSNGAELAQNLMSIVFVDKKTQRPAKIPSHLLESLACKQQHYALKIPVTDVDNEVSLAREVVRPSYSDTDFYLHTNHAVYIKMCMDGVTKASLANILRRISGDTANLPVKRFCTVYKSQTWPGQELSMVTWQDRNNIQCVYNSLFHANELVYHQITEFGSSNLSKI